ncbi:hypothetical protein OF83DRAFT_1058663 [Amylostereum chailletii]|nr:hypothetical protein OF83DRAFT_1058663 [Amylostereum chailletii]
MASPIVFYDVTCNNEGITHDSQRAVSVNTWRVRYALNIKGIPYKTVWLDYAEIKETIKALGAEPSGTSRSGEPRYTVPTIYDPSTKRTVTDSYKILDYLDAQYPDTPALLPPGTRALQQAFIQNVTTPLALTLFPVLVLDMLPMITETGAPVWRAMAEDMVGARLEQIVPQGEQRAGTIEAFLARLDAVGKAMGANGDGAVFLTGDAPSGADCDLAAWLTLWERVTAKKEGALWKQIMEVSTWCQWAINVRTIPFVFLRDDDLRGFLSRHSWSTESSRLCS